MVTTTPTPASQNIDLSLKLRQDMMENYKGTSWIADVKLVTVKVPNVEVYTDLNSSGEKASRICGGVSSLYYSYNRTNQLHSIIVYGSGNKILIRRLGISQQCN